MIEKPESALGLKFRLERRYELGQLTVISSCFRAWRWVIRRVRRENIDKFPSTLATFLGIRWRRKQTESYGDLKSRSDKYCYMKKKDDDIPANVMRTFVPEILTNFRVAEDCRNRTRAATSCVTRFHPICPSDTRDFTHGFHELGHPTFFFVPLLM